MTKTVKFYIKPVKTDRIGRQFIYWELTFSFIVEISRAVALLLAAAARTSWALRNFIALSILSLMVFKSFSEISLLMEKISQLMISVGDWKGHFSTPTAKVIFPSGRLAKMLTVAGDFSSLLFKACEQFCGTSS